MTRFFRFFLLRLLPAAALAAVLPLRAQTVQPESTSEEAEPVTTLEAQQMTGNPDREVTLEGDVEIIRGDLTLTADRATYNIIEDEVHIVGNVWMKRPGETYSGDELRMKIEAGQGYLLNPTYRLARNNGQGNAERIDFSSREQARVRKATYSTCEAPDPDWYLKASTLDLDTARDVGTAWGTVVYFKGVPILGSPYLSFPISDERKSGLLPPTIGTTNKGGLEVTLPYYFNIAPNRDLTLYPKVIGQRGLQLGAHGRYLGESYRGEFRLEGMAEDRLADDERWALSATHFQQLSPRLTFSSNLNAASDDNYPNDFPNTLTEAKHRLLLRELSLGYAGDDWAASARTTDYQVLQDPVAPIVRPYARLPQLTFRRSRYDGSGFEWSLLSDFTSFWHPEKIDGDRLVFNPRISYPILSLGYFFRPSLSLHATHYALPEPPAGTPDTFDRVVPTFSVDSGLTFERDTSLFGSPALQTLEPRLFYVYTPYRQQSAWPGLNFDSAPLDFNFTQIFSENRFSGHDLIGDANQLTAAVVSRYLGPTGSERLRFAIAQRYYFEQQRVTIGTATGNANLSETRSDILLAAAGQVTPTFRIDANTQYSQALAKTTRANYGLYWRPAPKRVLNLQYRRDLVTNLEQIDLSGQWPIAKRWYTVGRVNYSIRDREVAETLLGFEYLADCWIFRMVGQRTPTATGVASTSLFFQLELTGLSRLGADPLDVLRRNIEGYQLINRP